MLKKLLIIIALLIIGCSEQTLIKEPPKKMEINWVNETINTINIPIPSISIKSNPPELNIPLLIDNDVDVNKLNEFFIYDTKIEITYKNNMIIKEKKYMLKYVKDLNLDSTYGLKYVRFTNSPWGNCGDYLLDGGFYINLGNKECEFGWKRNKSQIFLHELKHHYCWFERKEVTINHQGCFLDTPIDKEYGIIK